MARKETEYPPHVQRAIDEAREKERATLIVGGGFVHPNDRLVDYTESNRRAVIEGRAIFSDVAKAKAIEPEDPYDSKLEREYAEHLERLKLAGKIRLWDYGALRFELGDGAWFKPDFAVIQKSLEIEIHETKGHWREAARVRMKVAASRYPWLRWIAITRVAGEWREERF